MTASVRNRFAFTVAANLLRSLLSFTTGMLLARWLGPDSFGRMAFLLGTFLALRQLLDLGTGAAFFTFMSQRSQSKRFVDIYFAWLGLQFLIPLCVIGLLFPASWIAAIWHGEERWLVLVAFVATFMQFTLWPAVQYAGESQRRTVWVQRVTVTVVAIQLLAVVLLWTLGKLGLYAILAVVAIEYLLAAIVVWRSLSYAEAREEDAIGDKAGSLFRQYLRYCLPLIPYVGVGFAYEFADRWLLQSYGGSVQQAFYSVGGQIAAVSLIATSSILSIFWKEIAEAHYRGDHTRTAMLYRKVSRLLFFIGAAIAGFLLPWTEDLLGALLGAAYVGGATTLAIMVFYPVHQSMGQIGDAMLYATERVWIQVCIGIVFMILSIGATYLLLAPPDAAVPGLGLASTGVALKMVVLQLIRVNITAYVISRIWKWRFDWTYQPVTLIGCAALGWLAHLAVIQWSSHGWALPASMGAAGVLYAALLCAFVFVIPGATGLTRDTLVSEVLMFSRLTAAGLKLK